MSFQYEQSNGTLTRNGQVLGVGYSGNGDALNNPAMQAIRMHGPLPRGQYTIQAPSVHPKLGPIAMELLPFSTNTMFLRGGFFIHGDNAQMNHTASDGCMIFGHDLRVQIAQAVLAGENQLTVVA